MYFPLLSQNLKGHRKRRSHTERQLHHSLDLLHENRKMEGRVAEIYQKISGVGILERTMNGTNKIRDMSKRSN